ncbi:restriction endonuclease subunit S [Methylomonas koyamae]|uniref:restriction endonuclease subunit S n=1 Tax=Methylomonas koyamae TaxID=702114 RepID=UPI00287308DD|nr:restriction endonuclease subunit S [Methylomonas koyamae]WNB74076.1 restriction endonuclease subunit S [Methylomonas koyamae]
MIEQLAEVPTYEAYKDSGVEWLGEIPAHWDVKPGFTIFNENKRNNRGMKESQVLSLSYGNIVVKPPEKLVGLVPESFETYQLVEPGDIIVRCTDLQNDQTSLRTGLAKDKGIITSAYLNLLVKKGNNSRYWHYYLHSLDITKVIYKFGSGLRQNLSYLDFKRLPIFDISLSEQTSIAAFLDRKTAQIDQAVAIKEQQISLLKERKQILIQNAVTRGLDPNVPMRDSGVEWIGEIPAHWNLKRLKYILNERNERSKTGQEPLFMVSQTHGLVVRSEFHEKAEVAQSNVDNKIVYKNDLVFNKLKAHLGVFFKSNIDFKGLVSPDYAVYHSNGLIDDLKYLEHLFRHPAYIGQFIIRATGIVEGLIRLYTGDLFKISIPVPPKQEQKTILAHIETQSAKIDQAIAIQQQQIDKLKEYKATLINSTVTGKIRVPESVQLEGMR